MQETIVSLNKSLQDEQLLAETLKFRVKLLEKQLSDLKHEQEDLEIIKHEYRTVTLNSLKLCRFNEDNDEN